MIIMKKLLLMLLCAAGVMVCAELKAAEYGYVWNDEFPNYKHQIPSSDFTTSDGLFSFTSEKADGVTGPQFNEDNKAGLLLRLYADNTLRIESLSGAEITAVTFVIGGNGHYALAELAPSTGEMKDPYLGMDATDKFKEYRLFWEGSTKDITFTVGHECEYGIDCAEQSKPNVAGTCMTKEIIITTKDTETAAGAVQRNDPKTRTVIYNGQVYILREGNSYTLTGTEIK